MLVTKMEATYFKKATGTIFFICEQGKEIATVIDEAAETGEAKNIITKSAGKNKTGELVATFLFTWSFKTKSNNIIQ